MSRPRGIALWKFVMCFWAGAGGLLACGTGTALLIAGVLADVWFVVLLVALPVAVVLLVIGVLGPISAADSRQSVGQIFTMIMFGH
jgi:hypothetical protein